MAKSRTRSRGFKKPKVLLGLSIVGFILLLTYEDGLIFDFKWRQVPLNLSIMDEFKVLTLDDILLCVKTSKQLATTRLPVILKTWFQFAKQQTWFFTDEENYELQNRTNGHMVNTNCTSPHKRDNVNCKMEVEVKYFMMSGKKWFCHFDDDNYVNVPRLLHVLQDYNYKLDWYLGKRSSFSPVKMSCQYFNQAKALKVHNITFWFGTGGAGFCISKTLAIKMYSFVIANGFKDTCNGLTLPDDVCIGFIINYVTQKNITLTHIPGFHSHIESMKKLCVENFQRQISFSYSSKNTIDIPGFNTSVDPSRFLSLHCFLFPNVNICRRQ